MPCHQTTLIKADIELLGLGDQVTHDLRTFTETMFPHGYCLAWDWRLVLADVGGDLSIFIAYAIIPMIIFVAVRTEMAHVLINRKTYGLWFSFVLTCGVSHAMSIFAIFYVVYATTAVVKLMTGIISLFTAMRLSMALRAALVARAL